MFTKIIADMFNKESKNTKSMRRTCVFLGEWAKNIKDTCFWNTLKVLKFLVDFILISKNILYSKWNRAISLSAVFKLCKSELWNRAISMRNRAISFFFGYNNTQNEIARFRIEIARFRFRPFSTGAIYMCLSSLSFLKRFC